MPDNGLSDFDEFVGGTRDIRSAISTRCWGISNDCQWHHRSAVFHDSARFDRRTCAGIFGIRWRLRGYARPSDESRKPPALRARPRRMRLETTQTPRRMPSGRKQERFPCNGALAQRRRRRCRSTESAEAGARMRSSRSRPASDTEIVEAFQVTRGVGGRCRQMKMNETPADADDDAARLDPVTPSAQSTDRQARSCRGERRWTRACVVGVRGRRPPGGSGAEEG